MFKQFLENRTEYLKRLIIFSHDIFMAVISVPVALYLRLGGEAYGGVEPFLPTHILTFALVSAVVFYMTGLYRGVWRYASVPDLVQVAKAVTISIIVAVLVLFFVLRLDYVPRSFPVIQMLVLGLLLTVPRLAYRWYRDRELTLFISAGGNTLPTVLLIGAGDEAEGFIRSLNRSPSPAFRIVGLVAERSGRVGQRIQGIEVITSYDKLESVLDSGKYGKIDRVILTRPDDDASTIRTMVDIVTKRGIAVARLPRVDELQRGTSASNIQDIAVEDLLGRTQRDLDKTDMQAMLAGNRVLVTGAGGSIGAELVRQVCATQPSEIILLDVNEYQLYEIDREISVSFPDIPRHAVIANIRDKHRIHEIFGTMRPDVVFHAAALKHVPLVEENPLEGIATNVIGSRNIADACLHHQVRCMVQISTDKAVNPTNVMGTSKRIAEQYIQALDPMSRKDNLTSYVVVRFGNVLGSTGSVVPLFKKQLIAGGPITVTHADMTRYFMTIAEAVQLVMQAGAIGCNDTATQGRIFVLDMGEPVKIVQLAEQMVRLSGQVPNQDIDIVFTGLRAGEKMYEELLYADEELQTTPVDGIRLASPRTLDYKTLSSSLDGLETAITTGDLPATLSALKHLVPEFNPDDRYAKLIKK